LESKKAELMKVKSRIVVTVTRSWRVGRREVEREWSMDTKLDRRNKFWCSIAQEYILYTYCIPVQ
jgi:hypothetical protein